MFRVISANQLIEAIILAQDLNLYWHFTDIDELEIIGYDMDITFKVVSDGSDN